MSKTSVPFAPETLETIQRAIRMATERRHDAVGLEHLLLAATDEPQARRILISCGADVETLRRQVTEALNPFRVRRRYSRSRPSASIASCSKP
jgi:ATP-dependent Clp protease ATP-binding subunit ClpA